MNKVNRVIRKKLLPLPILLLFVFSVLSVNMTGVSAGVYPAIYVDPPEKTGPIDTIFTVSIDTNYTWIDITAYQFSLYYNPSVLKGIEVTNGDIITIEKHNSSIFKAGTFDNEAGELSLTVGYFKEEWWTAGPGTLANVTFTVVGEGASTITLGSQTALIGWWYMTLPHHEYTIIDAETMPDHIQHGYFQNAPVTHDIAVASVTPSATSVINGSSVDITVVVENQGNINEAFNVTAYANTTAIETKTVTNLGSGRNTSLTFAWDTTGEDLGTYTIWAEAIPAQDDDLTNNSYTDGTVRVFEAVYLPVAIITAEETEGYVNQTLTFSGEGSYDPDGGAIIAHEWDFDDGTTGTGTLVFHKYNMTGIYTVTLVVTDTQNQVSYPAYFTIAIEEELVPPPYYADLVKWKAKPEAHRWVESQDDDGNVTLTALARNLGTEPINVSITFAILDAVGGVLAGPVIVEDVTLEVPGEDVPVNIEIDPTDYGYTGAKIVLYAHVTLKYDSDGDGTPDTIASSKIVRFLIWP